MTWIEQITDDVESSVYEIYLLGNPKRILIYLSILLVNTIMV